MPARRTLLLFSIVMLASCLEATAACIPFSEAQKHIGANRCVTGKVLHVKRGNGGVHFFDFCEDYRTCPFTVVVFAGDLKQVGDVRQLQGKQIEIEGEVKGYDGRAEIILRRLGQLRGDAARIPPLPKEYDVERRGKYSAGTFSHPKTAKSPTRKKQSPRITLEDPSSPSSPTD
ncbi:MAG: OB-fold nucleic acid binding domain-containing protein [Terriglobales bacterium]